MSKLKRYRPAEPVEHAPAVEAEAPSAPVESTSHESDLGGNAPAEPVFTPEPVAEAPTHEPTPEETAAEPAPRTPDPCPRRFSVHLACRIPIGQNPLVVEAADEQEAWREFCRLKLIGETDGAITIKEIHAPEPAGAA